MAGPAPTAAARPAVTFAATVTAARAVTGALTVTAARAATGTLTATFAATFAATVTATFAATFAATVTATVTAARAVTRAIAVIVAFTVTVALAGTPAVARAAGVGGSVAPEVLTNTTYVEALAADASTLWVATQGGVEAYDLPSLRRRRVFTTADGLGTNHVRGVSLADGGGILARTTHEACILRGARFTCTAAPTLAADEPGPATFHRGARVTAELTIAGQRVIGTAGAGVWLADHDGNAARGSMAGNDESGLARSSAGHGGRVGRARRGRRLTPRNQICGNHVMALAAWHGRVWLGSFDSGLCSFDGDTFRRARLLPRMINDVVAVDEALYVGTTKGLFASTDGTRFRKVAPLGGRGVTDLAYDEDTGTLWAVTPLSLWRVPTQPGQRLWEIPHPGGTTSIQAVDAHGGVVWLATEDRGALKLSGHRLHHVERFDRAAGLPTSWALDIAAAADGGAYIATLRHGLVRVDGRGTPTMVAGIPDAWLLHVSRSTSPRAAALTAGAATRSTTPDRLWVGTQGGAAGVTTGRALSGNGGDAPAARTLPALPDPRVHAVSQIEGAPTIAGLWAATEGGTARYRRLP